MKINESIVIANSLIICLQLYRRLVNFLPNGPETQLWIRQFPRACWTLTLETGVQTCLSFFFLIKMQQIIQVFVNPVRDCFFKHIKKHSWAQLPLIR